MNVDEAWKLMGDNNINFSDRQKIKSAFANWGREVNPNIERRKAGDEVYFINKNFKHYGFSTDEEADFAEKLMKYLGADETQTIKILGLINKIGDKKGNSF